MSTLAQLISGYAVESGEMPAEVPVVTGDEPLVEVLAENLVAQGDLGVIGTLDRSEQAVDIAVQLDELADRAELVEQATDMPPQVLEVSVESLHREFSVIMRSHKLQFAASSFESAGSDLGRVTGLRNDARRLADFNRQFAETLIDYTSEGAIGKFLRNDVSMLEKSRSSLLSANQKLQKDIDLLRERPVTIRNEGYARFMTQDGRAVLDLNAAIEDEAKYLSTAHDAVEQAVKSLQDAANKLAGNGVGNAISSLKSAKLFSSIEKAESGKGALMGNYTIKRDGAGDGLTVPKFVRTGETGVNFAAVAQGAVGALFSGVTANAMMKIVVIGGLMLGAPAVAAVAAATATGATAVAAAAGGFSAYHNENQTSESKSRAGVTELQKAVQAVLGYSKYIDYGLDAEAIQKVLKQARGNTEGLSDEQKKDLSAIVGSLETSLNRLVRLADEIYEQAYYTTTMMASLIDSVMGRLK